MIDNKKLVLATALFAASFFGPAASAAESGFLTKTFSDNAGGSRSFIVQLPSGYPATPTSTSKKYRLVLIFAGNTYPAASMQAWFGRGWNTGVVGMEGAMTDTIFVYPDEKYTWNNGNTKGWRLGPNAGTFGGNEDIVFVDELVKYMKANYLVNSGQIFATGHSWGGDMTNVVGCFLPHFKAIASIGANKPSGWFTTNQTCAGTPHVWVTHGAEDNWYNDSGLYGQQLRNFWAGKNACGTSKWNYVSSSNKSLFKTFEEYQVCNRKTIYSEYWKGNYSGSGSYLGHQPYDSYMLKTSNWFMTF